MPKLPASISGCPRLPERLRIWVEGGFWGCACTPTTSGLCVSGSTTSPNFPKRGELTGQGALKGGKDVFVTKLNPSVSQILNAPYLGGSAERCMTDGFVVFETGAMRTCPVDAQGRLYVSSATSSPDFPITPGPLKRTREAST